MLELGWLCSSLFYLFPWVLFLGLLEREGEGEGE